MSLDLEALGFTKEELQQRVIDQLCDRLLMNEHGDEDDRSFYGDSEFRRDLDKRIKAKIDETVTALADKHVLPNVAALIEGWVLQQTTQWGEKRGEPVTFTEYLVQRADAWMREDVDSQGRSKGERDSYNWSKHSTRMVHAINSHLQYQLNTAMAEALSKANTSLNGAMEGAARQAMIETAGKLSIKLELKR